MIHAHSYRVGILPWRLSLDGRALTVKALWSTTVAARNRILKVGFAHDQLGRGGNNTIRVCQKMIHLPDGPKGLIIVYEKPDGKTKDLAFTFDPKDRKALDIIEELLTDADDRFFGVGHTHVIRAAMGLKKGDLLFGFILTVVIVGVLVLLMYLGILR